MCELLDDFLQLCFDAFIRQPPGLLGRANDEQIEIANHEKVCWHSARTMSIARN